MSAFETLLSLPRGEGFESNSDSQDAGVVVYGVSWGRRQARPRTKIVLDPKINDCL
jgi:hypothetical protein